MPPCRRCHSEVDEQAYACPACGWAPRESRKPRVHIFIGGVLCMTGIGAILGLPLLYQGFKRQRELKDAHPYDVAPA